MADERLLTAEQLALIIERLQPLLEMATAFCGAVVSHATHTRLPPQALMLALRALRRFNMSQARAAGLPDEVYAVMEAGADRLWREVHESPPPPAESLQ